jgi:hypothetical protein
MKTNQLPLVLVGLLVTFVGWGMIKELDPIGKFYRYMEYAPENWSIHYMFLSAALVCGAAYGLSLLGKAGVK